MTTIQKLTDGLRAVGIDPGLYDLARIAEAYDLNGGIKSIHSAQEVATANGHTCLELDVAHPVGLLDFNGHLIATTIRRAFHYHPRRRERVLMLDRNGRVVGHVNATGRRKATGILVGQALPKGKRTWVGVPFPTISQESGATP